MNKDLQIKIIELLSSVKREGIDSLIKYLKTSDFFTAPASSKHHLNIPGGLAVHSYNVYKALKMLTNKYYPEVNPESVILCGLGHDFCKIHFYKIDYKNKKNEEESKKQGRAVWEKVEFYNYDDHEPLGHGEKSVILLQQYIKLTMDEVYAIRWHMGGWGEESFKNKIALGEARDKCKLLRCTILADELASYLMEEQNEKE